MLTVEIMIDRLGRVVIPKALRDELGLVPGTLLHIEETAEGLLIKRPKAEWPLVLKEGILVYGGRVVGDTGNGVVDDREERIRKVGGRRK